MFLLNYLCPLLADDWDYSFTHFGKRISNFHDIFITQYDHYFSWGGRSVVHIIAQTLLWMNKTCADLLNSLAYVVLIFIMYSISNKGSNRHPISLILIITISMWFLQGNFTDTTLWITGSANYLWGCLIILIFLYPYCLYYYSPIKSSTNIKSILFFISGIVTGWTNENMALALIFFIIVLFILLKKEKKEIPNWAIAGLIGVIIGAIFLFAAPGNYVRYKVITKDTTTDSLYYIKRIKDMILLFIRYGAIPSLIYFTLLFISYKQNLHKIKTKAFVLSLLFYASSILGIFVMIGSPSFPPRAWLGVITFAIIAISILYANLYLFSHYLSICNMLILTLGIILFCISYNLGTAELYKVHNIFKERDQEINKQKKLGNENIILYGRFKVNKKPLLTISGIHDLPKDISKWENKVYAKYHGVKTITILNDTLIQENNNR